MSFALVTRLLLLPLLFAILVCTLITIMDMNSHTSHVISACSYHLRNINHISRYLPPTTKERVINALITSRIDYCNSLLYNTSANNISRLQRMHFILVMRQRGLYCVVQELTAPRQFYANCIGYQSRVGFSTRFYSSATR